MEKGDIVNIYRDPITCEKLEGKARLLYRYEKDHYWRVKFIDDHFECDRWIYPKDYPIEVKPLDEMITSLYEKHTLLNCINQNPYHCECQVAKAWKKAVSLMGALENVW